MSDLRLPLDFSGRVCVVTGAGQGIGRAIARVFAAHGAEVAILDRCQDRAEESVQAILADGGRASALTVDIAEEEATRDAVAAIDGRLGRIDVLVHNAAYFPLTPFEEIDGGILDQALAVNLKAAFWLTQAALPAMKRAGRGRILVTSSVTGPRVAYPGLAHYAASKAGLNGFIRAAALELAPHAITVNGIEPGMIATPAMDNLGDEEVADTIRKAVPLGRLGRPEDIAFAMAFLASDAASYITGQTLTVDGGALLPEGGATA